MLPDILKQYPVFLTRKKFLMGLSSNPSFKGDRYAVAQSRKDSLTLPTRWRNSSNTVLWLLTCSFHSSPAGNPEHFPPPAGTGHAEHLIRDRMLKNSKAFFHFLIINVILLHAIGYFSPFSRQCLRSMQLLGRGNQLA